MSAGEEVLEIVTIYNSPADHPGRFVARRWVVVAGNLEPQPDTDLLAVGTTLAQVRAALPPGLYCMPRQPGDDPTIVESWL